MRDAELSGWCVVQVLRHLMRQREKMNSQGEALREALEEGVYLYRTNVDLLLWSSCKIMSMNYFCSSQDM